MLNVSSIKYNNLTEDNLIEKISNNRNKELYIESMENKATCIFVDFFESNKKLKLPEETNINCMWDFEPFDNQPYGIPIKKIDNIYYLFGNFSSPECAAAYLFDSKLESDVLWERYSMLNYLYSNNNETIKLALPRLVLKKMGGTKTIEQFRAYNNSTLNKEYKLILPPVISIIPTLEEVLISSDKNSILNKNINMDYKIQRNKPLPDYKNTLENCMNLKYV